MNILKSKKKGVGVRIFGVVPRPYFEKVQKKKNKKIKKKKFF
jgi:hypothetical protein